MSHRDSHRDFVAVCLIILINALPGRQRINCVCWREAMTPSRRAVLFDIAALFGRSSLLP
jgi:hypothetical protein